ncbi:MAG: hypothetical protein HY975_02810 [Candidatus Kerfeldbacteria bacterium]|nr:hypothetical protein [Candidatus Kerfeldbacteria bacterium]
MTRQTIISKLLIDYFRWVAGAVAVVVIVVGYILLLSPKISELRTSALSQRLQAQETLKTEQTYAAALQDSVNKFHQALPADQLKKVDDFIPTEADFPGLLMTIKNIAQAANLSLTTIAVGQVGQLGAAPAGATTNTETTGTTTNAAQAATATNSAIKTQDVSISVADGTSYEQFKNFLKVVESSQRLFDVVSLNFATDSGSTTTSDWTFVLRTYYLPETK